MKKFRVTITYDYIVEAESKQTAKERAAELWNENVPESFSDFGIEIESED